MIIELWERLRGYDKWIETTARFEAADVEKHEYVDRYVRSHEIYASCDTLAWADTEGNIHRDTFKVGESSPLYLMVDGEEVTIRYDPARPGRYYYRALFVSRVRSNVKATLAILGLIALLALRHYQRRWLTGAPPHVSH